FSTVLPMCPAAGGSWCWTEPGAAVLLESRPVREGECAVPRVACRGGACRVWHPRAEAGVPVKGIRDCLRLIWPGVHCRNAICVERRAGVLTTAAERWHRCTSRGWPAHTAAQGAGNSDPCLLARCSR